MAFDLRESVRSLVIDFPSDRAFVDRILSLMFFSGLDVIQQITSNRFGTGIGLLGTSGNTGGRPVLLITPLERRNSSILPSPPLEALKLARLDLLTKIWLIQRLSEDLVPVAPMIAAYPMDPLGLGLSALFNEFVLPRCKRPVTAQLFASGASSRPVKVDTRPAAVTLHLKTAADGRHGHGRLFSITVSNRKRLNWQVLLTRIAESSRQGTVLQDMILGGWDRSRLMFASFSLWTGDVVPEWPSQWRVREIRSAGHETGMPGISVDNMRPCLESFGSKDAVCVFLSAGNEWIECTYIMPPQRVTDFVARARKSGAVVGQVELYSSRQGRTSSGMAMATGLPSLLHSVDVYLACPPVNTIRSMDALDEWSNKFLNFFKAI